MSQVTTGKRLAKNTAFMYGRMIALMIISLYTSRVILKELGVVDFGIYSVVGSVVAMFGALRGLFATSTQRFMNYEMGRGNAERLQLVFNIGSYINFLLAVVFVIGVEIVGYWFLNYEINIEPDRLLAAKWVFQLSVAAAVIGMMTTPYDAVLIAHERMDFYAIMAIIEGILRLVIVFMLAYAPFDKLVYYAALQIVVSLLIRFYNASYCKKRFPESHYKKCWDRQLFKDMSAFAGWNFFGNMAFTLTDSGLNMLLNVFGGPIVNAARGISYQIKGVTMRFLDSVTIVVNPYNTKLYASGQTEKFFNILHMSTKAYFMIQLCLTVPLTYATGDILYLWLGQVPDYAVIFTQLILIHSLIRAIHYPINNLFKSAGKLKAFQMAEIIILALPLLFSYITLKLGAPYASLFVVVIVLELINFFVILLIARKEMSLSLSQYALRSALPCLICFAIAVGGFVLISMFVNNIWLALLLAAVIDIVCVAVMYFLGFNSFEQQQIRMIFKINKTNSL